MPLHTNGRHSAEHLSLTRRSWLSATLGTLGWWFAPLASIPAGAQQSRALNVHEEIRRRAREAPMTMQFRGGSVQACHQWQSRFGAKLEELLGSFRPPEQWETHTEHIVDFHDHRRHEFVLSAEGHPALPVYLLVPRRAGSERCPGVLALQGHGPFGYDPVAGIETTPERKDNIARYNYDYGRQLVRRGYVVAAPCFTPFGRRLDERDAYGGDDACAVTHVRMQLLGKLLMAENLRDALWALELLADRDDVDGERLGCVGLSYGGRMTMLTTALEPRIRVAVVSGALNVMQERITHRYSCGAQVIPGLLEYGDVPEIASLIAPRPCLWEVGSRDRLMVKDWIEPALTRIRRAYRALDAERNLQVDRFEGGHQWHGEKAYPLLAQVLRPPQPSTG